MKASTEWMAVSGAAYDLSSGQVGYAYLKNYTVEFRVFGQGPPLVLVPGLAGGMELLGPLARALAPHFRVISYQLRGEDDCFALRHQFGMNDLVQDLAEFLDWQCLERPTLFGVSFGGAVALEFASRFPGRLQALVVQGAGAHFEQGLLQQVAGLVLDQYPLPSDNPFVNQFFNLLFGKRERQGALVDFVTRRCWQTDQGVMAHRFRLIEHHNLDGRLGRIDVPTLVLAGERDLMVSPASLEALNAGLPDARCRRLEGCGHLAFVTRPGRVASEVTDFCDGL